jgi:hypothetical protein
MQGDSGVEEYHAKQMDPLSQHVGECDSVGFNSDIVPVALEWENKFYTHMKQQVKLL